MFQIDEIQFTKDHIWLKKIDSDQYYVGITDFAQDLLGDVVFVDIPLKQAVKAGDTLGIIESVKTSSDIICPTNALVTEINPILKKSIELINDKPYETWLCKITKTSKENMSDLLNHEDYQNFI